MEKPRQVIITFIFLIVLVAGLYAFTNWFSLITGYFTGEGQQESLVNCLNEQGAEFYYSLYSPESEKQAKEFGRAFEKIRKVDCGKNKANCPNIREIPAWYIPNSKEKFHYGFLKINELTEMGNCQVNAVNQTLK